MKKLSAFALCLMMTPMLALAIPMSWHDSLDIDKKIKHGKSRTFTHDIGHDGFDPLWDIVGYYNLKVGIRDDKNDRGERLRRFEIVKVDQPGFFGDATRFSAQDINAGWSLAGLVSLNISGMLDVTVKSLRGDFILESSKLWAHGYGHDKPTDVPEPGSLALLGLGLVGLGLARRRLSSQS